ncbi:TonB-dependent receptor [Sphingobacterium pedocola]|uniref:TonB-dependent receptor n=1 Tax=Sphingobacterium pedocola TaxID=2082722 RepID=A0ABR9TDG4_9SPHI|nr:TonB-dependent receptor [Sphingobacterium pedocola]MBE8722677.1 TonB-dependent receptor [Sphingobacterium pedocola]
MSSIRIISILLIWGYCSILSAQTTSIVSGIVSDIDNRPIDHVSVHIQELSLVANSNKTGQFSFSNIPSGTYSIQVSKIGYDSQVNVINTATQSDKLHFTLLKDTSQIDEVTIFGFSPTQLANRQAYNITAIDATKLHNTTTDIAHVLDRVPGVRLRESGGVGSDYEFSIHGFSGKRIRFFLDGVPMEHFGPAFQINNIPINLAERIEVYKGVVPIWLGSDVLGGAVNIISGRQWRDYLDVAYSFGSFNTHRSSINAGKTFKNGFTVQLSAFQNYADNNYPVTVDASDIRTGQYFPNSRVKRFHDQYRNETAIVKLGFVDRPWADQLIASFTLGQYYKEIQTGARMVTVYGAWHTRGNMQMPALQYQKKDAFVKGLTIRANANYNFGRDQSIDTVHARYGWMADSIRLRGNGGELQYNHYIYRNNAANASATVTYARDDHFFAFNHVYNHFDRKGFNDIAPHEQQYRIPQKTEKNITALSYQYSPSTKWSTTLFGKYNQQNARTTLLELDPANTGDTLYHSVDFNRSNFGYGLATTYFITSQLQLKASYEKTNRLPESEDLFGDVINKEGNWAIKPERSDNFNLGLDYTLPINANRIFFSGAAIYYHAKNYIYYTFNNIQNRTTAKNLEGVSNMGFESSIRYSYKQTFAAGINLTYQNIRNMQRYIEFGGVRFESKDYKFRLPNIPYLFGHADASLFLKNLFRPADQLTISYNMLYVKDFYLYWADSGRDDSKHVIPQQLAHDLNIVYTLANGRYNVGLEGKNISDQILYDNFSLQKPGRAFYLKLRYFIKN